MQLEQCAGGVTLANSAAPSLALHAVWQLEASLSRINTIAIAHLHGKLMPWTCDAGDDVFTVACYYKAHVYSAVLVLTHVITSLGSLATCACNFRILIINITIMSIYSC